MEWTFTAHSADIQANPALAQKAEDAKRVRFISDFGRRDALANGVPEAKSFLVHIGVEVVDRLQDWAPPNRHFRIVCPANLVGFKGHRYLIEASAQLRDRGLRFSLGIAGAGPEERSIRALVDRFRLWDRVEFLGHVPHQSLLDGYRRGQVSLVALPSVDLGFGRQEGIPVALMEAMANGVPVVSTLAGGTPELVPSNLGLLVPPADALSLANSIQVLMEDAEAYRAAAEACHDAVKQGFDRRTQGAQLAELIFT